MRNTLYIFSNAAWVALSFWSAWNIQTWGGWVMLVGNGTLFVYMCFHPKYGHYFRV